MSAEKTQPSRKRLYEQIDTMERHLDSATTIGFQHETLDLSMFRHNESLCGECQRIDLKEILSRSSRKIRPCCGIAVVDLGKRLNAGDMTACSLCRLFAAVRVPSKKSNDEYHLRALSFLKSSSEVIECGVDKALKNTDTICLVVIPGNSRRRHSNRFCPIHLDVDQCQRTGFICPVSLSSPLDLGSFGGRLIEPDRPNFKLLRS